VSDCGANGAWEGQRTNAEDRINSGRCWKIQVQMEGTAVRCGQNQHAVESIVIGRV
jgi:hypothetical protein